MLKTKSLSPIIVALALTLTLHSSVARAGAIVDEAIALLNAGNGKAAFELLDSKESEQAGDPAFDFLLGLAALEIGQNTRAVFALERVLAVNPNHVRARAEIGRAYLALGEYEAARNEFETVQRQGVPEDVSLTLERYIAAVRRVQDLSRTSWGGYVELSLGYDSNINLGPNRTSVVIPGISSTPAILLPDSRATRDYYGQIGTGLNVRVPLDFNFAVLGGLSLSHRINETNEQFNLGNFDTSLGVSKSEGKHVLTLMGQLGQVTLDKKEYRKVYGLTGQWQYNYDARNQISGFGQLSQLNYQLHPIRDSSRSVAGFSYAHLWRHGFLGFSSLYLLKERAEKDGYKYLGFHGGGFRVGLRKNINAQTDVFTTLSWERRKYGGEDPAFLVVRKDDQYDFVFGASYALSQNWSVSSQLSLSRNDSNTLLNQYERKMVALSIRREF
jgi:tetratricopeptide (TPR) repeat protein